MIWLDKFPLPPSVNEYLMPVAGKWVIGKRGQRYQQGRWVKTDVHRKYMDDCYLYKASNQRAFENLKQHLDSMRYKMAKDGLSFCLKVDCYFVFHVERIFTKAGEIKELDADNRLKPCRDALSKLLEIDDRHFFDGVCEKVTTRTKESECTIIRISPMVPRTLEEIREQMKQNQDT